MQPIEIVPVPLVRRALSPCVFAFASLIAVLASPGVTAGPIERQFINPATGYTQVVAVTSNGVTTLFVSGQVSEGDTIEAQLRGAYIALRQQLADAGAELTDVVKLTTYIVNYESAHLDVFRRVRSEFFAEQHRPASTLIGVAALALPEYRVEIEATAMVAKSDGAGSVK
jgi:enamine deaminase RidA (YjgF/YER057c/UK114 family)